VAEPGVRVIVGISEFVFEALALFGRVGKVIVLVLDAWAYIAALVDGIRTPQTQYPITSMRSSFVSAASHSCLTCSPVRGVGSGLQSHRFEYDDEIRSILKQFGTDEATVDEERTIEYLRTYTEELDLIGEIEDWREDLIQYGLEQLTDDFPDPNDEARSRHPLSRGH